MPRASRYLRLERQAHWTDALAVGSQKFVTFAESLHRNRRRLERWPVDPAAGKTTWALSLTLTDSAGKSPLYLLPDIR